MKTIISICLCCNIVCAWSAPGVPILGFARSFPLNHPIRHATITVLETGQKFETDQNGHFGPIIYPVNRSITLQFEKWGYITTQSGTYRVPPNGLTDTHDNITFQVPSYFIYYLFTKVIGAKLDPESCHVATTVTARNKTLDDEPQGEPGVTIDLIPTIKEVPFYFDIFNQGVFINKTNPFSKNLKFTSEDGGAAYFNVPVSDQPYTIIAKKKNRVFTQAQFYCRKNVFINLSPPGGPTVI